MDRMLSSVGSGGTSSARRSVLAALTIVSAVVFVMTGTACESSTSSAQFAAPVPSARPSPSPLPSLVPVVPSGPQQCGIPAVTGISPRSGAGVGHDIVVITGRCFTSVREVEFGASLAPAAVVDSSTQITATSPPGTGTVYVTVVTSAGRTADSALSQFTYKQSGALSSLAGKPPPSSPGPAGASPGWST